MAAEKAMDAFVQRLDDSSQDVKAKAAAAAELRDSLDQWIQSGFFVSFLSKFMPLLLQLLDGPPSFISNSPEHQLRNTILEIFHRFPQNQPDALKQYAPAIIDKVIALFEVENEDNAVVIIKIFLDFQRSQAPVLGDRIGSFLNTIIQLFKNMETVVKETFSAAGQTAAQASHHQQPGNQSSNSPRPASPALPPPDGGSEQKPGRVLAKSTQSFKVLAECPITVVSIFQQHKPLIPENLKLFVPLVKSLLLLEAPPQAQAHADAKAKGTIFVGVADGIKNRAAYADLITAQVKTMSFLAYILRSNGPLLNDFTGALPEVVIRLLKDCPKEKCGTRKELLVAIRHIINFNFRKIFMKSLDELLDERILLGEGLGAAETQKGLAYSLLADLIHHLRDSLTDSQIRLAVRVYTKNLADTVPGTSFQTMSAKLLMNMAEKIAKMEDKQEARLNLMLILDSIGDKFADMNRTYKNTSKISAQINLQSSDSASSQDFWSSKDRPPDWDEIDIFSVTPIKVVNTRDRVVDPLFDNRFLFRNLVTGLKNLFYQLHACNPPSPVEVTNAPQQIWKDVAYGFNADEVKVLIKLFHEGIRVFQYFPSEKLPTDPSASPIDLIGSHSANNNNKEERELLETFATVFHHVDPAVFHEVFGTGIPYMYDLMFDHPALLQVPQFLLASEATSPAFAGMLLEFLMKRINDVGSANVTQASILLRLFKLSFMAVTLFAHQNEVVLLPHIHKLITQSLELATTAEQPMHYFYLLRSLFRSIGGGKFEHLYKEILPLLEMLLEKLNNLILCARSTVDRDLFVELSLTVPARLSHLLPHLSYLMKPLVLALRAGSELVGQGLRTLELCVDNLTAEYLDPIMAPVIHDLMTALWDHLQPAPYSLFHAHTTMRILGKLGGRNRRFLEGPPPLDFRSFAESECSMDVHLIPSTASLQIPATLGLQLAIRKLEEVPRRNEVKPNDSYHKQQALNLIIAQTKLFVRFDAVPEDFAQLVRLQADDLADGNFKNGEPLENNAERERSVPKLNSQQDSLRDLLKAIMYATSIPYLADQANEFLSNIYRHFAILEVGHALADGRQKIEAFDVDSGEGSWYLEHRVIIDAIVYSLSSEKPAVRETAEAAIDALYSSMVKIFGSPTKVLKAPIFSLLLTACCHSCFKEEWFTKAGGSLGIKILAEKFGADLISNKQLEICRALIYAAKDLPDVVLKSIRAEALETLSRVIRISNESATREDVLNRETKVHQLCVLIIMELSSVSRSVREAAQAALALLAELTSMEIHEIVSPMKLNLYRHVFTKPLRSVAEPIQVGYIEAIAFCLQLGNGVLERNENVARFLSETATLASQDDDAAQVGTGKSNDERHAQNVVNLKVACLHLLSLALDLMDNEGSSSPKKKPKVIAVFFKSLYSRSEKVVDAGNEALKVVVAKDSKLPKDILQTGLRPILVSLGDPENLHVQHMSTLARLLLLLKSYFKVEIGSRLLENVFNVADRDTLQKCSFLHIEQQERTKVLAAVFNVFHLLPEAAREFMNTLVSKAIELEHSLRRTHFSTLREPVTKYLNRYPHEAWDQLFSQKLDDREHSRFLAQILSREDSQPLREVVVQNVGPLAECVSADAIEARRWTPIINTIQIVAALCQHPEAAKIVLGHQTLRKQILEAGKALELLRSTDELELNLRLPARQAGEQVLQIMMAHIDQKPDDVDCLFAVLEGISSKRLRKMPNLWESCVYRNVIASESLDLWKAVFTRCLDVYTDSKTPESLKVLVFRIFISPMIAMDIMRNWDALADGATETKFMTKALIDSLIQKIWVPQSLVDPHDEGTPPGTEATRMELLQMTTLFLKYCGSVTAHVQRLIARFAFVYIKVEDVLNKYAAYVAAAYYFSTYKTPAKPVYMIYTEIVRAHISEARVLVTQALEVLAPVLRERTKDLDKNNAHPWITAARKPIQNDPSLLSQTQSILNFVARHPDLFYEARDIFTMTIMSVLPRIAPVPANSLDNKKTALNFLTLIWNWQEQYATETSEAHPSPEQKALPYLPSASARTMILKYLGQFITTLSDRYPVGSAKTKDLTQPQNSQAWQATEICVRSLEIFEKFISAPNWSDIDVIFLLPKMEIALSAEPKPEDKADMKFTQIINTLQLLRVVLNTRSDDWIVSHLPHLQKLLEKFLRNPHRDVQECLHSSPGAEEGKGGKSLVLRILEAVPPEPSEDDMDETDGNTPDFISFLTTLAADTLTTKNAIAGINIFRALADVRPRKIDDHFPALYKNMQMAAKDHFALTLQQSQQQAARADPLVQEQIASDMVVDLLVKLIDLLGSQIAHLGDNRRPYLTTLTNLLERSPSKKIYSKVLDLVNEWVFAVDQTFPNVKEKAAVILKMIPFVKRDNEFRDRYLDLIARVYEDPKIKRTELAVRLESAFLVGTSTENIEMRNRFVHVFDASLTRSANKRFIYLLAAQDWHELRDKFWLSQVIELLFGSVDQDMVARLTDRDFTTLSSSVTFDSYSDDKRVGNLMLDDDFETFMESHRQFCATLRDLRVQDVIRPLAQLQLSDSNTARQIWRAIFPIFWSTLVKDERAEMQEGLISLMAKEYHQESMEKRPNCIQVLMEGIVATPKSRINFPSHVMKYLAKTFDAWYSGMVYMEENAFTPIVDTAAARESNQDALAETYAALEETDMFYGLWRRRCDFLDTLTALSFEQHGDWEKAQKMFEAATLKARTGASPYKQGEYMLWEDHWIRCAMKLQQWEVLSDFAKNDNLNDLFLDAIWRTIDFWHSSKENQRQLEGIIKLVSDAPTPRRAFFQSFMALLKLHQQGDQEQSAAFTRINDDAIQLSIRKWHQLPKRITNAHVPILQNFQQLCELYDAHIISQTISTTTAANIDQKAPELKLQLNTWRDRLPNFWDDINAWQELVTWRQHIFNLINRKYLQLIPSAPGNVTGNSLAYRGYHETASIINRFAHVARKHNLPEVCISMLSKIYTLPNIEIQEAFLKLREQAKCHYHNPNELQIGLDVINNTNLNYFGPQQKAEFYTLKGMFLAKQGEVTPANDAFGSALFFDLKLAKAWAEWARYNDYLFKEDPTDIAKAASAIQCYLEAANSYKNAKSRKFLSRTLWLLTLDDANGTLAKAFDENTSETPSWYWITFIPQLLTSISRPEGRLTARILAKLARTYPQALFFSLRTSREDMQIIKRQTEQREAAKQKEQRGGEQAGSGAAGQGSPPSRPTTANGQAESTSRPGTANGEQGTPKSNSAAVNGANTKVTPKKEPDGDHKSPKLESSDTQQSPSGQDNKAAAQTEPEQPAVPKKPWDHIEDIISMLKTGYPLLALSLETMVDQLYRHMKLSPDEDAYRLITALHHDACSYLSRSPNSYSKDTPVPASTEANITRFATSVLTPQPQLKQIFEQEFITNKPSLYDYIRKLRRWRDKFEEKLDRRSQVMNLEYCGSLLSEYKFQKFDEVEIPGQYLLHKDNNKDFKRIDRFMPDVDLVRGPQAPSRRLWIRGHDGVNYPFIVQHPTSRPARRDERMLQVVRFFNDTLSKRKESRRRQLQFTAPAIVPLAPAMRIVQDDPSYITLQDIYDDHCRRNGIGKDDPMLFLINKLKELKPSTYDEVQPIRLQAFQLIQQTLVPKTMLLDYFKATHPDFPDFWLLRRQFAYQLATVSFLTYTLSMKDRTPARMSIARGSGNVWGTDLHSAFTTAQSGPPRPLFGSSEAVPFRLTPNLQMFLGPIALEGIFAPAMLVIAKALTEPSNGAKMHQMLSLFVRDEVIFWFTSQTGSGAQRRDVDASAMRGLVSTNCEKVVNKTLGLALTNKNTPLPINQSVLDLVAKATDPAELAKMDVSWMPWL